jgi:hypothetical protein
MSMRPLPLVPLAAVAVLTAAEDVGSSPPFSQTVAAPVSAGMVQRMQGRTVKVGGHSVSASDYFGKTPPGTLVTLRSGTKTTLGRLLSSYDKLDSLAKSKGTSVDKLQKTAWLGGAPPRGMQEAADLSAATAAQLTHFDPSKPHGQVTYPQGDPKRAAAVVHDLDPSYFLVNPYSHFNVTASDPASQDGTTCSVSWNAGLKLSTAQLDVVKIIGTESTSGSTFVSASLQIFVMGKSEFTGQLSVDGDPPFDKAISSSQLPGGDPQMNMDILPGVLSVHAVIGGSAYFKLVPIGDSGAVQSAGKDVGFYCSLNVQPTLRTEGHLRANADVGPTFLGMPALTVSGRGSLEPLRLDLPVTALVALHDTPVKIGFGLNADLTMQVMGGTANLTWALPDICEGGNCVMADGLGLPTSGELKSWEHTATLVHGPYVNLDAGLSGETLSSR